MKKLLCVLCMALSLVACDKKNDNPQNKPVVKIGMMLPLSGDFANLGDATKRAVKMVREDLGNTKNHYEFILEDSGADTAKASTIIRKLVFTDKINAVMGYISTTAMVVAPIANENKIPSVWYVTAPEASMGEYNFRLLANFTDGAKMVANKIKSEKKKNVAVVYQNVPAMSYLVKEQIPTYKQNLNVVLNESFLPDEKNFFALLQKIKKANPDYIILEGMPPSADIFMKQLRENNINIPVTGYQTIGMLNNLDGLDGMWDVDTPQADREFFERFKKHGGADNLYYADYVYIMLMALINGFENASPDNMNEFIAASAKIKSPIGELKVSSNKDLIITNNIYQHIVNGNKEIMEK